MKYITFILFLFLSSSIGAGEIPGQIPEGKESAYTKIAQLRPELVPICACESTGNMNEKPTHFNPDGSVKRGKINPLDIGICQINLRWNGDTAARMGMDLFKESDNIRFANWLYGQKGSAPWNWSKSCWSKK